MSVTARTSPVAGARTDAMRRRALVAGILYLLTFVSIPTLALYQPLQDGVDGFVRGAGSETAVLWGAFSEIVVGLAGIGTAVVLFPLLKRQSETAALGFVTTRVLEGTLIFVGVANLLSLISLRNDLGATAGGASAASLVATGHGLIGVYNGAFLVSQSLMPALNDLLLGYLLFRARLVPRVLPIVAFIGAPLLLIADIGVFFGAWGRTAPLAALCALPVALFELGVGVWLVVRGFNPSSPLFGGSDDLGRSGAPTAPPAPARV